jgi:hypothetical protein
VAADVTTVALSGEIADAVRAEAARTGRTDAEVVEVAVRRFLGPSILDQLWARSELTDDEAMAIALGEIRAHRAERRAG